jgi:hypothetical protein
MTADIKMRSVSEGLFIGSALIIGDPLRDRCDTPTTVRQHSCHDPNAAIASMAGDIKLGTGHLRKGT